MSKSSEQHQQDHAGETEKNQPQVPVLSREASIARLAADINGWLNTRCNASLDAFLRETHGVVTGLPTRIYCTRTAGHTGMHESFYDFTQWSNVRPAIFAKERP